MINPFVIGNTMTDTQYGRYAVPNKYGMSVLRDMFPNARVTNEAVVLFSTGGITGHKTTLEHIVEHCSFPNDEERTISFVILKPEYVVTMYGNAIIKDVNDLDFIKRLRFNSWQVMSNFGRG